MRLALILTGLFISTAALAGYDKTWHQAEFWSGEWPHGFSVVKPNVTVPARTAMDTDLKPTISCKLPYRAVFNPWNTARSKASNAHYWTASKIVTMTAKQDFTFVDEAVKLPIKKGDTLEYLIYYGEGSFAVRIRGKTYRGDQDLLEKMESVPDSPNHEWLRLTCVDGQTAWIYLPDLTIKNKDGDDTYIDGLWNASIGNPGVIEYGKARDLTEAEIKRGPEPQ